MGLLGDIYSAIDTKKRQVKGLLDDFGGTVDMGVRRFREDQQNLQNLFANAYPMAGDKTVLNSPQQIAQFQREAADKAGEMGLAGATVWHGSPHKFDKFDSSKIGTGEGAQAYGHGLYLAESPAVADDYAKKLGSPSVKIGEKSYSELDGGWISDLGEKLPSLSDLTTALNRIGQAGYKKTDAISRTKSYIDSNVPSYGADEKSVLKMLGESEVLPGGHRYKVDLPDEHIAKMLDWDKPLSEQAQILEQLGAKLDQSSVGNALGVYNGKIPLGALSGTNYSGTGQGQLPTGKDLYRRLHEAAIKSGAAEPALIKEKQAADLMRKAGIPGIRYLDGGSRGTGQGTSNFVVFPGNEGLLSILERNGQPVGGLLK